MRRSVGTILPYPVHVYARDTIRISMPNTSLVGTVYFTDDAALYLGAISDANFIDAFK